MRAQRQTLAVTRQSINTSWTSCNVEPREHGLRFTALAGLLVVAACGPAPQSSEALLPAASGASSKGLGLQPSSLIHARAPAFASAAVASSESGGPLRVATLGAEFAQPTGFALAAQRRLR
jgi:hypothetical protein